MKERKITKMMMMKERKIAELMKEHGVIRINNDSGVLLEDGTSYKWSLAKMDWIECHNDEILDDCMYILGDEI